MQRKLAIKIGVIILLTLMLIIPLEMISGKIYERQQFQHQAELSIARSWTGAQKLIGPLLVIPYTRQYTVREWDADSKTHVTKTYSADETLLLQPEDLSINSSLDTEMRYRGIYEVPVYTSKMNLKGTFSNPRLISLIKRKDVTSVGKPYVAVSMADIRGIVDKPTLTWEGVQTEFEAGSQLEFSEAGIHAMVSNLDAKHVKNYSFDFSLILRGMQQFEFTPVAKQNNIQLVSAWPHPHFLGRYLPQEREISDEGYSATWNISSFSTDAERQLENCERNDCQEFLYNSFGVAMVDPVDVYLQAERSIKYGLLFVGLIFVVFFLFEIIQGLQVHPIQYALVGIALSIFYLLLISLSEQFNFSLSYLIATIASTSLLSFYITFVLSSRKLGLIIGIATGLLYAMLFAIIQSEDHAMLMGSLLIFCTLSFVMISTRKVNWYDLTNINQSKKSAS